jgi:hypothetical protein
MNPGIASLSNLAGAVFCFGVAREFPDEAVVKNESIEGAGGRSAWECRVHADLSIL